VIYDELVVHEELLLLWMVASTGISHWNIAIRYTYMLLMSLAVWSWEVY